MTIRPRPQLIFPNYSVEHPFLRRLRNPPASTLVAVKVAVRTIHQSRAKTLCRIKRCLTLGKEVEVQTTLTIGIDPMCRGPLGDTLPVCPLLPRVPLFDPGIVDAPGAGTVARQLLPGGHLCGMDEFSRRGFRSLIDSTVLIATSRVRPTAKASSRISPQAPSRNR